MPAATPSAGIPQFGDDPDKAARLFAHLRTEHRSLGNGVLERITTLNLAETQFALGHTERAIALAREMLPDLRTESDPQLRAAVLANLAGYLVAAGDLRGACSAAREAIRELATHDPESAYVAGAIEHLALALGLGGDLPRAAALAEYAEAQSQRHGVSRDFTEATTYARPTALLDERIERGESARPIAERATLTPEAAVALALMGP